MTQAYMIKITFPADPPYLYTLYIAPLDGSEAPFRETKYENESALRRDLIANLPLGANPGAKADKVIHTVNTTGEYDMNQVPLRLSNDAARNLGWSV
jgi:hypothetical protein